VNDVEDYYIGFAGVDHSVPAPAPDGVLFGQVRFTAFSLSADTTTVAYAIRASTVVGTGPGVVFDGDRQWWNPSDPRISYGAPVTIHAAEITGGGSTEFLSGTIDDHLTIDHTINISPTFGSNGTVVMADGIIQNNGATVHDTGANPKGYVMFVTNSTDLNAAITLGNWSTGGVFLAVNGGVTINPHTHPVIISANRFNLQPNSDLTCDAGLGSASFVNGPGGFWQETDWQNCKVSDTNTCNL
jgi:hypothetical protein